jgi:prefoldin alpha subunit
VRQRATRSPTPQTNTVDLNTLSIPQLGEIKQKLMQEVEFLNSSFQKLIEAKRKFQDCQESVRGVSAEKDDTELMVPLSSSLYVPGRMSNVGKFMVDVGTGYYVEKDAEGAIAHYQKKVMTLEKNLGDLTAVAEQKGKNLEAIDQIMRQKIGEEMKKKQTQQAE